MPTTKENEIIESFILELLAPNSIDTLANTPLHYADKSEIKTVTICNTIDNSNETIAIKLIENLNFKDLLEIALYSFNILADGKNYKLCDSAAAIFSEDLLVADEIYKMRNNNLNEILYLGTKLSNNKKIDHFHQELETVTNELNYNFAAFDHQAPLLGEPVPTFISDKAVYTRSKKIPGYLKDPERIQTNDYDEEEEEDEEDEEEDTAIDENKFKVKANEANNKVNKTVWRYDPIFNTTKKINRDFTLFIVFLIIVTISVLVRGKVFQSQNLTEFIQVNLETPATEMPAPTEGSVSNVNLDNIKAWYQFWQFVDSPLYFSLVEHSFNNPFTNEQEESLGLLRRYGPLTLVTPIRFRQSRVSSYPIHDSLSYLTEEQIIENNWQDVQCAPAYNFDTKSKESLNESIANGAFVYRETMVTTFSELEKPMENVVEMNPVRNGRIAPYYDASGYIVEFFPSDKAIWDEFILPIQYGSAFCSRPLSSTNEIIAAQCQQSDFDQYEYYSKIIPKPWLDINTRLVTVEFVLFNNNDNIFANVKVMFESSATGGAFSKLKVNTLPLEDSLIIFILYSIYVGCMIIYLIFIESQYIRLQIAIVKHDRKRIQVLGLPFWLSSTKDIDQFYNSTQEERRHDIQLLTSSTDENIKISKINVILKYFSSIRTFIHVLLIVFSLTFLIMSSIVVYSTRWQYIIDNYNNNNIKFASVSYLGQYRETAILFECLAMLMLYLKLFGYFNLDVHYRQILQTIEDGASPMIFLVLLILFVHLGLTFLLHIVIGQEVAEFSIFSIASYTLLSDARSFAFSKELLNSNVDPFIVYAVQYFLYFFYQYLIAGISLAIWYFSYSKFFELKKNTKNNLSMFDDTKQLMLGILSPVLDTSAFINSEPSPEKKKKKK